MANINLLNCQTCGGKLNYSPDGLTATCPYCGNEYHFKNLKGEALSLALNRANLMRLSNDFDGAITEYKLILADDPEDAEANWGLALSLYGIEYVDDARTKKLIPTCRRTVKQSILQNQYYLAAIRNADGEQAAYYTAQAKIIDRLQRDIMRRMDEEENFDVFLCFRSADDNGYPTKERTVARRIYDELTRRGIKTFFSEVTLKDRLGDDYEPIIYKALYSCKFFVLIAASEQNINSPWVKNEWSRFRDRAAEEGLSGACCAVFEGISFAILPAFLRSVQGVNLAKYPAGGYEIELADNLCKKFNLDVSAGTGSSQAYTEKPARLATMLRQAQADLNDEIYGAALEDYQNILKIYPDCGDAWWGCFLAERKANTGALAAQKTDFEGALTLNTDRNLRNAELYGDGDIRAKIASYKKMCIYRCGELSSECNRKAEDNENKIKQNQALLAEIAKNKEKAAKKRENCSKFSDKSKFNRMRFPMIFGFVFVIFFFIIFAVVIDDDEATIIFSAMIGFFVLAAVAALIMMSVKRKQSISQADELGRQVTGYYAQEQSILKENENLKTEQENLRRKAQVFNKVFR